MELTIQRNDLIEGLQKSQSVAEKRSSMPVLSNVLLEARDQQLHLTATNLEVSFTGSHNADIDKEGAVTIQARKFYEIVKELPFPEVRITEKENQETDAALSRELDEAVDFALNSPNPEDEESYTDVYCESL